jgi:hypothetical protein
MDTKVNTFTLTIVINIRDSTTTGMEQATFSVPGMSLSSVSLRFFKRVVKIAKLPIPRVSKKICYKTCYSKYKKFFIVYFFIL